jgi:hypothetical protein
MRNVLWNLGQRIPLGFVLGLAVGGTMAVSQASAEPKDCTASCECQRVCEENLVACNATCSRESEDKKIRCHVDCNQKLLGCMEKCPKPDCSCGAY